MKPNGHDKTAERANGHGSAFPSPAVGTPLEPGSAASDDKREFPAAAATKPVAAGMERDAYAEVAGPAKANQRAGKKAGAKHGQRRNQSPPKATVPGEPDRPEQSRRTRIPRGKTALAADGAGFVDVVHQHVDLYRASAHLVRSADEKISQRMVERLLEMKFGKGPAAATDEGPEYVFDIDSAVTRRAVEGAKK